MTVHTAPVRYREYHLSTHTDTWYPGTTTVYQAADVDQTVGTNYADRILNKDWQQMVAKGQDAGNPYTLRRYRFLPCRLRCGTTYKYSNGRIVTSKGFHTLGGTSFGGLTAFPTDEALRDLALTRLKRKISSDLGRKDMLVPIAELRELRGLLKQVALMGVTTMQALLDLRKGKVSRLTQQIADVWLMFGFGIAPTLQDISEVCKAIQDFMARNDHTVRLRAGARKTWFTDAGETARTGGIHYRIDTQCRLVHTLTYVYTGGFDFTVKSSNDYGYGAEETFGFERVKLPSLYWELVPFSWVFDYFINMSAYLEDTFVLPPGSSKYLSLSSLHTVEGNISPAPVLTQAGSVINYSSVLEGYGRFIHYKREKLTALPRVGLHFKSVDSIGGQGAMSKLANLAAVLVKGLPKGALDNRWHYYYPDD